MYLNLVTQVGAQKNNFATEWLADGLTRAGGGGGGKRRGLGPRNDVLTTCKVVTQRGGQRIITVFSPQ